MIKTNCRVTLSLSLVVSDITKESKVTLYVPNDQSFQLKAIINFTHSSEKEIVKQLLEFSETLKIVFDITSKNVVHVMKV